jgi:hypothetical protein
MGARHGRRRDRTESAETIDATPSGRRPRLLRCLAHVDIRGLSQRVVALLLSGFNVLAKHVDGASGRRCPLRNVTSMSAGTPGQSVQGLLQWLARLGTDVPSPLADIRTDACAHSSLNAVIGPSDRRNRRWTGIVRLAQYQGACSRYVAASASAVIAAGRPAHPRDPARCAPALASPSFSSCRPFYDFALLRPDRHSPFGSLACWPRTDLSMAAFPRNAACRLPDCSTRTPR